MGRVQEEQASPTTAMREVCQMTQSILAPRVRTPMVPHRTGQAPALSLREPVPSDWHHDRPAYAGDPDMDWINLPEAPREANWGLPEDRGRKN